MGQISYCLAKTAFEGIRSTACHKTAIKLNLAKGQILQACQRRMCRSKIVDRSSCVVKSQLSHDFADPLGICDNLILGYFDYQAREGFIVWDRPAHLINKAGRTENGGWDVDSKFKRIALLSKQLPAFHHAAKNK